MAALEIEVPITERKAMEEEMRRGQQELAAILDSISELVVYQDLSNRVVRANRAAGSSVGEAPQALTGRLCHEIWHHRSEVCELCPVVAARESGRSEEREVRDPFGRVFQIRGNPVRSEAGEVIGIVEVAADITERVQAQEALKESEERFRMLADLLPQTIFEANLEGRLTYHNRHGAESTGYSDKDLGRGLSLFDLIPPGEQEELRDLISRALAGEEIGPCELTSRRRDETTFPVLVDMRAIYRDGRATGLLGVVLDITDRRRPRRSGCASSARLRRPRSSRAWACSPAASPTTSTTC